MKTIHVRIPVERGTKTYPIMIGAGLAGHIGKLVPANSFSRCVIVSDSHIPKMITDNVKQSIGIPSSVVTLPCGEKNKNIASVELIWKELFKRRCDRSSLVVAVGGGLVSDVAGFAASTFMRGIAVVNVPTTLLSQVDASIGGKTGMNAFGIKNIIGSFHQPIAVVIDVDTLKTLPTRELLSGFAEVIKHGLIADKKLLQLATSKKPTTFMPDELETIIARSCAIKAQIVGEDEKEKGKRRLLNFGHTIGHAIETLSLQTKTPLLHGEAVAWGMITETFISHLAGLINEKQKEIVIQKISVLPLQNISQTISISKIMKKIQSDKKNSHGVVRWTLLEDIGHAVVDRTVPEKTVIRALKLTKGVRI